MSFHDPTRLSLTRRRFRRAADIARDLDTMVATDDLLRAAGGRPRRIVLTGGPGSGKSTAASFLAREFVTDLWVLPEAATLLYRGGMPRGAGEVGVQIAQRAIFGVQRSLEQAHGLQHPTRVQLCDRGTVDGAAYWPAGADAFFESVGTTRERELARYDAVIFLHTAALLPAGYERDLEVRTEDRDLAVDLDRRIFDLYASHPRLISIESRGSFLDKLTAVRNAVADLVEQPQAPYRPATREAGSVPVSTLASLGSMGDCMPG